MDGQDAELVSSLANFLGVGVLVLIFGYLYITHDAKDKASVKRD